MIFFLLNIENNIFQSKLGHFKIECLGQMKCLSIMELNDRIWMAFL